jgi:tRNA modification GTPase
MRYFEQIEGSIDFPDEVPRIDRQVFVHDIGMVLDDLRLLLSLQDYGKWIRSGVQCVIIGRPNVGKSSLLNRLVGESRAIVTSIPGTTRDFIDAHIELGGVLFTFVDTAGLRSDTMDTIEILGMKRIKKLVNSSEAICWVLDASEPLTSDDLAIWNSIKKRKNLYLILNKADKKTRIDLSVLKLKDGTPIISLSTKKAEGLDALKSTLYDHFVSVIERVDVSLLCNVRQIQALKSAKSSLEHLLGEHAMGVVDDALSIDLKQAILILGEVTGEELTEEMLDGVFSRFCVGK